ncbi:MAG TPA: MerR family transcriptional regulator [Actinomycetes bacterium]
MRDPVERKTPSPEGGGGQSTPGSTGTMSIGEVLAVLKPEFADITVSKIRFLEGAGLVQPDRSASGYRKFSDDDVARLRFVLRAQRDQYLPLRVIRQRLADLEQVGGLHAKGGLAATEAGAAPAPPGGAAAGAAAQPATEQEQGVGAARPLGAAPPSDAQFTREELCRAAGATVEQLLELESFGLIGARGSGERGAWYGGDDLVLLRTARELADYGLEARHLRMYKLFAEREAALFEQVVAPLVRQRNPEARARARQTIEALAQLGSRMRELALRAAVRGLAEARDPHR